MTNTIGNCKQKTAYYSNIGWVGMQLDTMLAALSALGAEALCTYAPLRSMGYTPDPLIHQLFLQVSER